MVNMFFKGQDRYVHFFLLLLNDTCVTWINGNCSSTLLIQLSALVWMHTAGPGQILLTMILNFSSAQNAFL
jgi:hypothetical protein